MCEIFKINRRNIYRNNKGKRQKQKIEQFEFEAVEKTFYQSHQLYGYLKCSKILEMSEWKVREIYRILRLKSRRQTKNRKPKEIKVTNEKYPNLVARDFNPLEPNKYWHTDVSYLPLNTKYVYLSIVIDSFDNQILDWKISCYHDTNLVLANIEAAISKYRPPAIIHSDHGYEYKSYRYLEMCQQNNIQISMSRIGNSLDNRSAEFFFAQLKRECLKIEKYCSLAELTNLISIYVRWYNESRIQKNLNWQAPATFAGYVRQ